MFVLVITILAVSIEQPNELLWNLEGVRLARLSTVAGNLAYYLGLEACVYLEVCVFAQAFYSLAAIGWSCCLAWANTWSRPLTYLSVINWPLMLVMAIAPGFGVPLAIVNAGTGVGFNIMALWMVLVLERVLMRSRPDEKHGRMMIWKHPYSGLVGKILGVLANSRLLQYVGEFVPSVTLVSDIENVVYINYLVDAESVESLVPPGLTLQKIGPEQRYALFSVLTYRHGSFGPRCFGPLRKFCPSPVQSNWRIHVIDSAGTPGIYFVSTTISDTMLGLVARWLSDGVPMHVMEQGSVACNENAVRVRIDPGNGSAPQLEASLRHCTAPTLSGNWQECFQDFDQFLAYCVPQDRALSSQPWYERTTSQEINLNIAFSDCQPLEGEVQSRTISQLLGDGLLSTICFRVPSVSFVFDRVERVPWKH